MPSPTRNFGGTVDGRLLAALIRVREYSDACAGQAEPKGFFLSVTVTLLVTSRL